MKTITVLGNIVTLLLVTLTLTESMRLSAYDRKYEFTTLKNLRQTLAMKYLRNYNEEEALAILSQYVLDVDTIFLFAIHLNKTGNVPEWSKPIKLENPKFYELVRYNNFVDFIPSEKTKSIAILTKLKKEIFKNSPNIAIEKLIHNYEEENLNELISLEEYYAINVLLKHRKQMHLLNPVGWRIKRALLSLAIRQYSLNLNYNYAPKNCFVKKFANEDYAKSIKPGRMYELNDFMFFKSHNVFEESNSSSPIYIDNKSSHWISFNYIITEPRVIVNLEEVVKNKKHYVLLPKTIFTVKENRLMRDTFFGVISLVKIETNRLIRKSEWLTRMANNIEKYKKMEEEYFENLQLSSSEYDSD